MRKIREELDDHKNVFSSGDGGGDGSGGRYGGGDGDEYGYL